MESGIILAAILLSIGVAQVGFADFATLPAAAAGLHREAVGVDGIAVVVHPDNTVTGLTLGQLQAVFGGEVRDWAALGGRAHAINLVVRESGSGTREAFEQHVRASPRDVNTVVQDNTLTVLDTVGKDPNAVGYVSHSAVDARVREVPIDGVACSPAAIQRGDYPLTRPVWLLSQGRPQGTARAFADFVLSEGGEAIIRARRLVPAARRGAAE